MTITLIVPAYNEGPFIERCINSIKNQTIPFDQVIFIDDHSTDGTTEMIRAHTEFVRIEHPDNRGVSASRNSGLEFDGELKKHIIEIERRHNGNRSNYALRMRNLCKTLAKAGIHTPRNYAIHRPMLVNRAKALEVMAKFPEEPMFRALYGNLTATEADSTPAKDCKVTTWLKPAYEQSDIISTDDKCFAKGAVGRYIRERFTEPSRWES